MERGGGNCDRTATSTSHRECAAQLLGIHITSGGRERAVEGVGEECSDSCDGEAYGERAIPVWRLLFGMLN